MCIVLSRPRSMSALPAEADARTGIAAWHVGPSFVLFSGSSGSVPARRLVDSRMAIGQAVRGYAAFEKRPVVSRDGPESGADGRRRVGLYREGVFGVQLRGDEHAAAGVVEDVAVLCR